MRIAILTPSYFPNYKGAERIVHDLSKGLTRKGHKVYVLCPKSCHPVGDEKGVKVLPLLHEGWSRNIPINSWIVLKILFSAQVDLLHIHFAYPYGLIGVICKLILGVPYVITSHGWDIQKDQQTRYGARFKPRSALQIWLSLRLANAHTIVSRSMLKDAVSSGSLKNRIFVVYPGLRTDILSKTCETEDAGIGYQAEAGEATLLYVGRLVAKKGVDTLIQAAPYILNEIPNTRFVIAGSGTELENLKKLSLRYGVGHRMIFTGYVSEGHKNALLRKAKVFVFPSRIEALGIAMLEAMAYGKAIVATDIPAFRELLDPNEAKFVKPNDPLKIAKAVVELLRNKTIRETMGNSVKKKAGRYSNDRMVERYEMIYKNLIERRLL